MCIRDRLYDRRSPISGITQPGTVQWLNPDAFVSTVDPSTGACAGGDSPANCQFGTLGRNALRGPDFTWSDFYLTKSFPLTERMTLRFDAQFFNVFNHPNLALPNMVMAGIPGKPSTQTGFGAISYATSPPTGPVSYTHLHCRPQRTNPLWTDRGSVLELHFPHEITERGHQLRPGRA